jgi:hypothetical protein
MAEISNADFPSHRATCQHILTLDSHQEAVVDAIRTLGEADFQTCYEVWKIRWTNFLLQRDVF